MFTRSCFPFSADNNEWLSCLHRPLEPARQRERCGEVFQGIWTDSGNQLEEWIWLCGECAWPLCVNYEFWSCFCVLNNLFFVSTLLRSLMTTEMQMMLCTSWTAKNCAVKGKNRILRGFFVLDHLLLACSHRLNGGSVTKMKYSIWFQSL